VPARGRDLAVHPSAEPGSFRDPDSRVFVTPDGVFRVLSLQGAEDWRALAATPLWGELQQEGRVVATEPAEPAALPDLLAGAAAAVLRHERVPFVSYPYEWPFAMLKDAALLQLELNRRALRADLALKDASPYNVQWRGTAPVFVDVGSFERLRPGEPWAGYRQFCMLFLYPLMLQAYKDLPFHGALRGSLDGIPPHDARALLAGERFRKGVMANVVLHARLEDRYAAAEGREVKREMLRAGFNKELLAANFGKLEKLVAGLEWKAGATAWTGYGEDNSYDAAAAGRKAAFVREAAARRRSRLTWDVGCNDGTYSRIAAESAELVLALDADHATVDALYRQLREERRTDILPLVMSVTDPSPDLGWRGRERASLERRGTPELTLALAVVHHVCIAGNVPVRELLDWLRALDTTLVIEFPERADPMVERLLSGKRDGANPDYDKAVFERALAERFSVDRTDAISETRTLYEARPTG
jgi:ribosomal protein L11 methylase PrmA